METVVERPAALEVHKEQVMACVRVPAQGRSREQHVAEFPTTVAGLLTLSDWLEAFGVTQVVMEATGVYWKPIWAVLEDQFECLLVNARHVKQVRPQDGRQGCRMALPVGGSRVVARELCAAKTDPDVAESDPVTQDRDSRSRTRG